MNEKREITEALLPQYGIRDKGGGAGWIRNDFKSFLSIIKSEVDLQDTLWKEISENKEVELELTGSIPTPLSRVWFYYFILSQRAYKNSNFYDFRMRFIRQMRHIWMVLAFRYELGLKVDFKSVDLNSEIGSEEFIKIVKKAIDVSKLEKAEKANRVWENIKVVLLENEPIAITSPLTLIVPAPDYANVVPTELFDESLKEDPLWRHALKKYMEKIELSIVLNPGKYLYPTKDVLQSVFRYLGDEIKELDQENREEEGITIYGKNGLLDFHVRIERGKFVEDFTVNIDRNARKLIVIPKRKETRGFRVDGLFNARFIRKLKELENYPAVRTMEMNFLGRNRLLFYNDEIWEEKCIVFRYSNGGKKYYLLPIKRRFLEALNEAGILDNVIKSMDIKSEADGITFTLRIPRMHGGYILLERKFEEVEMDKLPPIVIVYPYSTGNNALWNVVLFNHKDADPHFQLLPSNEWIRLQTFSFSTLSITEYVTSKEPKIIEIAYIYKNKVKLNNTIVMRSQGSNQREWSQWSSVALIIDVGTSYTSFCIAGKNERTGGVDKLYIGDLLQDYIAVWPSKELLSYIKERDIPLSVVVALLFFTPANDRNLKYVPTLFFENYSRKNIQGKPVVITDIIKDVEKGKLRKFLTEYCGAYCRSDVKWKDITTGKLDKRMFHYIAYMYMIHLASQKLNPNKSVSIYYSYPVKNGDIGEALKYAIKNIVSDIYKESIDAIQLEIHDFEENEALYYYFIDKFGDTVKNGLILDIGGGSTEYIYLLNGKVRFKGSAPIGGNMLFVDSILTTLEILNKGRNFKYPYSYINFLLFAENYSSTLELIEKELLESDYQSSVILRAMLEFKLFMIFYAFMWIFVNYLIREEELRKLKTFNIFVGGGMARVISEIYKNPQDFGSMISEYIFAPLQVKKLHLQGVFSPTPKLEVLHGMLCVFTASKGRYEEDLNIPVRGIYIDNKILEFLSRLMLNAINYIDKKYKPKLIINENIDRIKGLSRILISNMKIIEDSNVDLKGFINLLMPNMIKWADEWFKEKFKK